MGITADFYRPMRFSVLWPIMARPSRKAILDALDGKVKTSSKKPRNVIRQCMKQLADREKIAIDAREMCPQRNLRRRENRKECYYGKKPTQEVTDGLG